MKRILLSFIFTLFVFSLSAQDTSGIKQQQAAERFVFRLLRQDYQYCWKEYDPVRKPLTEEKFMGEMEFIYEQLPDKEGKYEVHEKGLQSIGGKEYVYYSFLNNKKDADRSYRIELIFADSSTQKIAGARVIQLTKKHKK